MQPPHSRSGLSLSRTTDVWFLGERVLRQAGQEAPVVPADPPLRMMRPDLLGDEAYAAALTGYGADLFLVHGASYADFVATRLAPFPEFVQVYIHGVGLMITIILRVLLIVYFCFLARGFGWMGSASGDDFIRRRIRHGHPRGDSGDPGSSGPPFAS